MLVLQSAYRLSSSSPMCASTEALVSLHVYSAPSAQLMGCIRWTN